MLNFSAMDAFKIITRCCQHCFLQIAEIKIFMVSCSIFQCFSEYENASWARSTLIEISISRCQASHHKTASTRDIIHIEATIDYKHQKTLFCQNIWPMCTKLFTMYSFVSKFAQKLQFLRLFDLVKCTVMFTYSLTVFSYNTYLVRLHV